MSTHPQHGPFLAQGDTERLDKLVNAREARDATVVANARALAFMRGSASQGAGGASGPAGTGGGAGPSSRPLPPSLAKDATPGSEVQKEAAGKPWTFSVDAMMADFLSNRST